MDMSLLIKVQEAVLKNVCSPGEKELDEFTIERSIRSSQEKEGDSQLGLTLFIGIAVEMGFQPKDIRLFLDVKRDEFMYKLSKYKRKAKSNDARFCNKIKLIKNYLRIKYNVQTA